MGSRGSSTRTASSAGDWLDANALDNGNPGFPSGLSTTEESTGLHYTASGLGIVRVNQNLRSGDAYADVLEREDSRELRAFDSLLSSRSVPVPATMTWYRGVAGDYATTLSQMQVGQVFTDRGFTFITPDIHTAKFAGRVMSGGDDRVTVMHIVTPRGTPILPMGKPIRGHREAILGTRGTNFRVVRQGSGEMTVEVVP